MKVGGARRVGESRGSGETQGRGLLSRCLCAWLERDREGSWERTGVLTKPSWWQVLVAHQRRCRYSDQLAEAASVMSAGPGEAGTERWILVISEAQRARVSEPL